MPAPAPVRRTPPRRSSGGGGGWFILLVLIGGAAALVVFAPNVLRQMTGQVPTPAEGPEPVAPQGTDAKLSEHQHTDAADLSKVSLVDRSSTKPVAKPQPPQTSDTAKPQPTYKEQDQAQEMLVKAEAYYKAFDWDDAAGAARKVTPFDAKPATKVRAQDIVHGAEALQKLFKELNEKDELVRNFDTDPKLVEVVSNGSSTFAVPIVSMDDRSVVQGDPIEWINAQRRKGEVTLLLRGKKDYLPSTLPSDQVGDVHPADLVKIHGQKQTEFETKLAQLKGSEAVSDALSWYNAAKFAYQNRLDELVTEMMDKAIVLDPFLARSVREDKAETLLANMTLHLKNGNKKQADAFMASINKRFADTDAGKQAKLLYENKTTEWLAAQRDAATRQAELEKQRRDSRMQRAQQLGDKDAVAQIEKEPSSHVDKDLAAASQGATGDEGAADQHFEKGSSYYAQAIDAGNSDARDNLYEKAKQELTAAMAVYNQLLDKRPNDGALADKAARCNQLRYGAIKQKRPFH